MNPQTDQSTLPARALASNATTAADAVRETAVAVLRASIARIFVLMQECDDPRRKIRLNDTLFLATQELAAMLRSQSHLSTDY